MAHCPGWEGYTDGAVDSVGILDALYDASVSVTTTGYGDITPQATPHTPNHDDTAVLITHTAHELRPDINGQLPATTN